MSDYDFINFFISRIITGGGVMTAEEIRFINKAQKDLYEFMTSPSDYRY